MNSLRLRIFLLLVGLASATVLFLIWPSTPATITTNTSGGAINQEIAVPIVIDTAGQTINAAELHLQYDPKIITVTRVEKSPSIFTLWIKDQPAFDNGQGTISLAGGLPQPGFKGEATVGTVFLRSNQAVEAKLTFGPETRILINDGLGTALPLQLKPLRVKIK